MKFSTSNFEKKIDSAILVRERTKCSRLEGQFENKAGKVVKEAAHTITFLSKNCNKKVTYSKRDVAKVEMTRNEPKQDDKQDDIEKTATSRKWGTKRKV